VFVGENPPFGALLTYYLKEGLDEDEAEGETDIDEDSEDGAEESKDEPKVELTVLDTRGDVVRTVKGPAKAGVRRVAWDLRHESISGKDEDEEGEFRFEMPAPLVLPGNYKVNLAFGDEELAAPVEVRLLPGVQVADQELRAQHDSLVRLNEMAKRGAESVRTIDTVKSQLEDLPERLEKIEGVPLEMIADTRRITSEFEAIRNELVRPPKSQSSYVAGARLLGKIRSLAGSISAATAQPTAAQSEWLERYDNEMEEKLQRLGKLINEDLAALNRRMNEARIPHIFSKLME
jgi:hypothetical protein